MVNKRRLLSLGLTLGLFIACFVLSSHTPTHAQGKVVKHPVMHKALKDLRDAHKQMKSLKPIYDGHRSKAIKHIDEAVEEVKKAIKFVDGEAK